MRFKAEEFLDVSFSFVTPVKAGMMRKVIQRFPDGHTTVILNAGQSSAIPISSSFPRRRE
jgi:hypothetical protein